jgi:hypothetical protein
MYLMHLVVPVCIVLISISAIGDVSSEADVLKLPVTHFLLGGPKKARDYSQQEYYREDARLTQADRIASVREVIKVATQAFTEAGVDLFLESGTLLGMVRNGDLIPWDTDADMGMSASQCREHYPVEGVLHQKIQSLLPPNFAVPYLECRVLENLKAGRVVDTRTGFFADIFVYQPVSSTTLPPSKRVISDRWIERISWPSISCPEHILYPLKTTKYQNFTGFLTPHNPHAYVHFQYRGRLSPPLFPWGFLCYLHVSTITFAVVALAVVVAGDALANVACLALMLVPRSGLRFVGLLFILFRASYTFGCRWSCGSPWMHRSVRLGLLLVAWTLLYTHSHVFIEQTLLSTLDDNLLRPFWQDAFSI